MPAVSKKQQKYFGYLLSNPEERKKKGISKKAAKDFAQDIQEVSPPGWGHTKAEKEKTKPNKPKSKIGGSAAAFKRALDDGRFKGLPGDKTKKEKTASMFKLMWSMKNKGDKPHYKPGTDEKKKKYQEESAALDANTKLRDQKKRDKMAKQLARLMIHARDQKKNPVLANSHEVEGELIEGKKKGLWDNIHAKRKRGEKPAKPGDKDYPKTLNVEGLEKARKNVGADKCWDGYKAKGTKKKGGKEVPNCVKVDEGAAWTKKSGKNPEGGLNEKGRKSYEKANPGSDLKAPQPEGGSRKKSFCARMGGMKKKLTSSKTANDPDSRINKSLRKWKCREDWKPEIEHIKGSDLRKKAAEKKRKEAADSLPPHLRLDTMKKAFSQANEATTMQDNNLFGDAYATLKKKVGSKKKHDKPAVEEGIMQMVKRAVKKKEERKPEKAMDAGARAKRKLARAHHAKYVSGSEDLVPDSIREGVSFQDFRKK